MFNLVPSNRQEFLLQVLIAYINEDYQSGSLDIFEPSIVMVESQGMKHYVNMGIARHCGVSMNIDFPLVTRAVYQLCRQILGEDKVPKESPYKREITVWRIEQILRSKTFCDHADAKFANQYWQNALDPDKARFMLAHSTADVLEQYMQFRPHWFETWQTGGSVFQSTVNQSSAMNSENVKNTAKSLLEPWQRRVWQFLLKEEDWYPAKIIKQATNIFEPGKYKLPKVIYIFVVNSFTPEQLEFLVKISQQVDIYLFHLNPCVEYWGDLVSEKIAIKQQLRHTLKQRLTDGLDSFANEDSANTLLANLGTQGRTLFNQLRDIDYLDYTDNALFEHPFFQDTLTSPSLLHAIQQELISAKQGQIEMAQPDNSISVHDCHSHLREIQVLHDFLLHTVNEDKTIKPHDIIVLCPAVEEYAPYVKGVFRDPLEQDDQDDPKLVCSIADRAPLDADPTVAMFMDMLSLPDSRFSVSSIVDYLQIESVQNKFGFSLDEVEVCEKWIANANIYWGKDATHKAKVLGLKNCEQTYTWEWGLERLLKSALYSSSQKTDLPFGMLESAEGLSMQTLGKLVLFIDTLQSIYSDSQKSRNMHEWLTYMRTNIVLNLFENKRNTRSVDAIVRALEQISSNLLKADYNEVVSLSVAREALKQILSKPDPLNQFNTGQVTFCSMVPMRSVPFKVICILGLNDGVFPRVSQPLSIDLLPLDNPKVSDRSRRNEDRYMFLEAIISARNCLYLSYQGRSIKNNSTREPSLVLREFCDYIKRVFGHDVVHSHPLQPFSLEAFSKADYNHHLFSKRPSFSRPYLKIASAQPNQQSILKTDFLLPRSISVSNLCQFFKNPLAGFSEHHLQLRFDNFIDVQSDVEPFVTDGLTKYELNQSMLKDLSASKKGAFNECLSEFKKSGDIPVHELNLQTYARAYNDLSQHLDVSEYQSEHIVKEFKTELQVDSGDEQVSEFVTLSGYMPVSAEDGKNSKYFSEQIINPNSLFEFCIKHALKRVSAETPVSSTLAFINIKNYMKDIEKYYAGQLDSKPIANIQLIQLNEANFSHNQAQQFLKALLKSYNAAMQKPSLVHVDLGAILDSKIIRKPLAQSIQTVGGMTLSELLSSSPKEKQTLYNELFKQLEKMYILDEYTELFFQNTFSDDNLDVVELAKVYSDFLPQGWSQIK